jgi:hypothetical protein
MLTIDDRRSASVRGCLGPLGDCLDNLDHRGRAVDSRPDVLVPHTTVVQCSRQLWRRQEDIYDAKKAQTKAKEFAPVSRLFVQVPAPRGGCGVKTGPAWFVAGAADATMGLVAKKAVSTFSSPPSAQSPSAQSL